MTATVHQGDAAAVLAGLPAASIHCAVTSPPYNGGVRRYAGLDDTQLGLEATVDEYVERLVAVFEAVKRVLHPTGVLFVNLGDTLYGAQSGGTKHTELKGSEDCDCACHHHGDERGETPLSRSAGKSDDHASRRGLVWAESNQRHKDSERDHLANLDSASPAEQPFSSNAYSLQTVSHADAQLRASLESTQPESSLSSPARVANQYAEVALSESLPSEHGEQTSVHKEPAFSQPHLGGDVPQPSTGHEESIDDNDVIEDSSDYRTTGTVCDSCSWRHYTTTSRHKDGQLAGVPWRFALAMQAAGWRLRASNIWAKTSSMPESLRGWAWEQHRVKVEKSARAKDESYHAAAFGDSPMGARDGREFADHANEYANCQGCATCAPNGGLVLRRGSWRPTRSHEYLFQFAKGERYYADGEAVKQDATSKPRDGVSRWAVGNGRAAPFPLAQGGFRNPRSVLHFPSEPLSIGLCRACGRYYRRVPKGGCPCAAYVGADEASDGMIRKESRDCPVHGNHQQPRASDDEPQQDHSPRTFDNNDYPEEGLETESSPNRGQFLEHKNVGQDWPDETPHVAKDHSKPLSKMGHVPLTNPSYTPSEQTPDHTDDRLDSREYESQNPDRSASNIEAGSAEDETEYGRPSELAQRTDHKSGRQTTVSASSYGPSENPQSSLGNNTLLAAGGHSETTARTPDKSACTCSYKMGLTRHFASFPTSLPQFCIKASTSEAGCCAECGAPWARVVKVAFLQTGPIRHNLASEDNRVGFPRGLSQAETLGWRRTCDHGVPAVPCTVLDPFCGSGSTLIAATRLGRKSIGVELSASYVVLARHRLADEAAQGNTPETVPRGAEAQLGMGL